MTGVLVKIIVSFSCGDIVPEVTFTSVVLSLSLVHKFSGESDVLSASMGWIEVPRIGIVLPDEIEDVVLLKDVWIKIVLGLLICFDGSSGLTDELLV